ncbi:Uncharacterized protein QJS10_CPB13g00659 [Acorus calamus]|uniref:NERD domain-containing protein n=1 Tax=Acorus calamus TaxID=4465 RepID=A0AAV9DER8_ACOCL|nr:Uncharacterized protein QJS10_CPB13g00659 [Acorus calamus]
MGNGVGDYRLISLVNGSYKMIAKVLANKLKSMNGSMIESGRGMSEVVLARGYLILVCDAEIVENIMVPYPIARQVWRRPKIAYGLDDEFMTLQGMWEVDLEKKARNLHVDITNHWIEREIVVLQNQIDRANEKGWRREYPLLNVKQLLMTEDEQARLLNILPEIIADEEPEPNAATESPDRGEFEGKEAVSSENGQKIKDEEKTAPAKFKAAENEVEAQEQSTLKVYQRRRIKDNFKVAIEVKMDLAGYKHVDPAYCNAKT